MATQLAADQIIDRLLALGAEVRLYPNDALFIDWPEGKRDEELAGLIRRHRVDIRIRIRALESELLARLEKGAPILRGLEENGTADDLSKYNALLVHFENLLARYTRISSWLMELAQPELVAAAAAAEGAPA